MTYEEQLMVEREPACFSAGFKAAFSKYGATEPVVAPTNWFRTEMLAAWRIGRKYGRIAKTAIEQGIQVS